MNKHSDRHNTRRLLAGAAILLVVAGAALAIVNFALDDTKVKTHDIAGSVREIVVRSDSGDVDLVAAGERVQVRETQHFVSERPTFDHKLEGGVLTLESHCNGWILRCFADLRVTVPAGVKVTVDADSGSIAARGIDVSDAHVKSDSGDIDLALVGQQALVWAHTDSGDVDTATAGARAVDAQTDSGDVDVVVPRGDYAVDADTDSGDVKLDGILRNDRASESIRARTDSGDVTVRAR